MQRLKQANPLHFYLFFALVLLVLAFVGGEDRRDAESLAGWGPTNYARGLK